MVLLIRPMYYHRYHQARRKQFGMGGGGGGQTFQGAHLLGAMA